MNTESWNGLDIPKIGFGTWKIGGGSFADPSQDARSLAALESAIQLGYTHFDTAEMYANGHSEELLGQAIRASGKKREGFFIATKVLPSHLNYQEVISACHGSLERLGMEYVDLYLIHWPSAGMNLKDSFKALNELVREGRIRHLGVSNFSVSLMQQSQQLSETPLLTNQVPYSLYDRSYVKNGVLEHCRRNNILVTAYSPVDEGRLRVSQPLQSIAQTHNVTPYQIALAWLVAQPGVITIPMSMNPQHQAENLATVDIHLGADETKILDELA